MNSDSTKKGILALVAIIVLILIILFLIAQFSNPTPYWLTWMPIFKGSTTNTSGTATGTATGTDTAKAIINRLEALGDNGNADLNTLLIDYNAYKANVTQFNTTYDNAYLNYGSINTAAAADKLSAVNRLTSSYITILGNITGFAKLIDDATKDKSGTSSLTTKSTEYIKLSGDITALLNQITPYLTDNDKAIIDLKSLQSSITALNAEIEKGPGLLTRYNNLSSTLVNGLRDAINALVALGTTTILPSDKDFFIAAKNRVEAMIKSITDKSTEITNKLTDVTGKNNKITDAISGAVVDLTIKSKSLTDMATALGTYKNDITNRKTDEGKRTADLQLVKSIFDQNVKLDTALSDLTSFYSSINVPL